MLTIPAEVLAAFLVMTGTVLAAMITGVAVVVARKIGSRVDRVQGEIGDKVDDVHDQVTANNGQSAHDDLVRRIERVAKDVRGVRSDVNDLHSTDRTIRAELRQAMVERASALAEHETRFHRKG